MRRVRIAAAAYPMSWFDHPAEYEAKITRWVEDAADCDLLLFPEYAAMELASLGGPDIGGDLQRSLLEVARHDALRDRLFTALAAQHSCHIVAPSGPAFAGTRPVNRAVLFGPRGRIGHQDKLIMTRFEREAWDVVAGTSLRLFDTPIGRLGILICYDAEFPLLARRLAAAGAEILLVPSCTDTLAGYHRVRIGAMARALESQCVVAQAPTVGDVDWNAAIDVNRGAAAIYGPPDGLWPDDGIVAIGALDQPGWVKADVELDLVQRSRREAAVLPFAHWPESADIEVER